jgi:hypothetical protein
MWEFYTPSLIFNYQLSKSELIIIRGLNMLYQDMLTLAAINFNKPELAELARGLTPEEWRSKRIGNKKLSRHLLSIGLDNKNVSDLLSATVTNSTTRIVSDEDTCCNQGNSIYYSSCQATDDRAKHDANSRMNKIDGDMKHLGKTLFFWVAGESMSVDGKGFTARAKLRIMYSDPDHTKIFGLWLENIYGNALILLSNFNDLNEWWHGTMQQSTPVYKHCNHRSNIPVFIPSAANGYQDTALTSTYYYQLVMNESLLAKAYKMRSKSSKTYQYPLADVKFNPQNCEFILPEVVDKPWRGKIDSDTRHYINMLIELFGFPKSSEFDKNNKYRTTYITFRYENNVKAVLYFCGTSYSLHYDGHYLISYYDNVLRVTSTHSGFYIAWDIEYYRGLSKNILDCINEEFDELYESANKIN